jgi:hypothetical protein
MARESEKIINFKGKQIKIRKFNVLDGCYIIQKILSSFLPEVVESGLGFQRPYKPTREMSRDEFCELLINVMQYATYIQKEPVAVEIPILNDNGSLAVEGLEFSDVFLLTIEVLMFNLLGFFTKENLEYFSEMMKKGTEKISQIVSK